MSRPFSLTPAKELEGLIEALNEAALDSAARASLAADPLAAMRDLGITLPPGLGIAVERRADGRVRLVVIADGPVPLRDDMLDEVVGGTLVPTATGELVIASFDL